MEEPSSDEEAGCVVESPIPVQTRSIAIPSKNGSAFCSRLLMS